MVQFTISLWWLLKANHMFYRTKRFGCKDPKKGIGRRRQYTTRDRKETPDTKPSKVKIFNETPKTKTSVRSKKPTFSVPNTHRVHSKISSDVKIKEKDEDTLPDIEKIVPFVDEGKNIINSPQPPELHVPVMMVFYSKNFPLNY